MDIQLITAIGQFGLGAVIALIVLYWKREDDKRHENYMSATNAAILAALTANTAALNGLQKTVETLADFAKLEDRIRTSSNPPQRRRQDAP